MFREIKTNTITIIALFLVFCKLSSCNNQFPISDFSIKEKLEVDFIKSEKIIAPMFFLIQGNRLCTYTLKKDTMIDMFSLPMLIHQKSFGMRGQGPDEFHSFPWPCKSTNDNLYIRGYSPLIIKQFSVDNSANLIEENEFELKTHESFGAMYIVQDSLLIYSSMGRMIDRKEQISIKKYNLNQKKETGSIFIRTSSPQNASIDPNRGGISANDSFIVYFYFFKKQIDIYDVHNMKLVKRMGRVKAPSINIAFNENISHYLDAYAGEKYFYLLYNKKGNKINIIEPSSRSIEVFDYNGNAIAEFTFDNFINYFAIDEINHCLYAYDITNEDFIIKYRLPEILFE